MKAVVCFNKIFSSPLGIVKTLSSSTVFGLFLLCFTDRVFADPGQKLWSTKIESGANYRPPEFSLMAADASSGNGDFFSVGVDKTFNVAAFKVSGSNGKILWSRRVGASTVAPDSFDLMEPPHHGCSLASESTDDPSTNIFFACPTASYTLLSPARKPVRPDIYSRKWLITKLNSAGDILWQVKQPNPAKDGARNAVTQLSLHYSVNGGSPDLLAGGFMTDSLGAKRLVIQRIGGSYGQIKWQTDLHVTSIAEFYGAVRQIVPLKNKEIAVVGMVPLDILNTFKAEGVLWILNSETGTIKSQKVLGFNVQKMISSSTSDQLILAGLNSDQDLIVRSENPESGEMNWSKIVKLANWSDPTFRDRSSRQVSTLLQVPGRGYFVSIGRFFGAIATLSVKHVNAAMFAEQDGELLWDLSEFPSQILAPLTVYNAVSLDQNRDLILVGSAPAELRRDVGDSNMVIAKVNSENGAFIWKSRVVSREKLASESKSLVPKRSVPFFLGESVLLGKDGEMIFGANSLGKTRAYHFFKFSTGTLPVVFVP